MRTNNYIIGISIVASLLAGCTRDKWAELPPSGDVEVHFTASAGTPATKTASGATALMAGANVTVHAWMGNTPSEADAPAYSNAYLFRIDPNKADTLEATGGQMQVQTGNGYRFYALSTNSAEYTVPGLSTGCRTVSLRNGVDYLMALYDKDGNGLNVTAGEIAPIPLAFRHLATQVVLTVKPATSNGYTGASGLTVGIADIDNTDCYIDLSATWDADTPSPMIYWPAQPTTDGSDPVPATGGIPLEQPDGQRKGATANGTEFTVSFIILPVSTTARGIPLQLDFTGLSFDGGVTTIPEKSYTARMMATSTDATSLTLHGGYTYTFEATITRNAATFSLPKVEPWVIDGVNLDEVVEVDPK